MFRKLKSIGPGILITSAFIGPGTVTVCSIAGYQFGYSLLWALVFSIIATIVLQEMCARLGLVAQKGLGEIVRTELKSPLVRVGGSLLVLSAILVGNGAYEAGNISGAAMGMQIIFPSAIITLLGFDFNIIVILIGITALALFISGSYKVIEKALILLVGLMSLVFIATAIAAAPSLRDIMLGVFVPTMPEGSLMLIIGLIGTTVVPYNLFLHSSSVSERWKSPAHLADARFDTVVSIALGGIISMAIVISAAVAAMGQGQAAFEVGNLALQLEPLLGSWAKYFMALGLFAAGISSAITAPLAAAYTTAGVLGFEAHPRNVKFKIVAISILAVGIYFSLIGLKPLQVIQFAQFANGLLLPTIAIFLLWIMNKKVILGQYVNKRWQNAAAMIIIGITIILCVKSIWGVIGQF